MNNDIYNGRRVALKKICRSVSAKVKMGEIAKFELTHPQSECILVGTADQGSQFTSEAFSGLLLERGIKVSMDGKGRYLDNIFVERLWRSVKYEEVYLKAYRDGSEARRGIDAYLDLYNRERPHQSLGYRTPAQVFADGRPLRCLPDQASALSSREAVSDFPAGVFLNLAPSLS